MLMPCPTASRCFPCFTSPIENISSENEDLLTFIGYSGNSQEPPLDPPNGTTWDSTGCLTTCESTISQEDADLCAQRQQIYCNTAKWHDPITGGPPTIFLNNAQSCSKNCPDGLSYTFTVPAGTFAALSQILADRMAFTYACSKAATTKICLSSLSSTVGCVGAAFTANVSISNAITPCTWEITSGALPDGLTLGGFSPNIDVTPGSGETIEGTPTAGGSFTFTLRCTDSIGRFMEKQYTLCMESISPNTLPNGTSGTAYSQALTSQSCFGTVTWSATGLPAGLSINPTTGLISGTPIGPSTGNVVVTTTSGSNHCSKTYSLTVVGVDLCVNASDWAIITAAAAAAPFPGPFSVGPSHFVKTGPGAWIGQANPPNFPQTAITQDGGNNCLLTIQTHAPTNATWSRSPNPSNPAGVYTLIDPDGIPGLPATITVSIC